MKTQNYSINLDMFDGEAFCRAACWYDLVNLSCDEVRKIFWLGKPLTLKPNQLATSVKLLADRWNMTAQTARNSPQRVRGGKNNIYGTHWHSPYHHLAQPCRRSRAQGPRDPKPKLSPSLKKPQEPQEQKSRTSN